MPVSRLLFLKKFLTNPRQNASIMPSSTAACRAMTAELNFALIDSIVELGPGLGNFTELLLQRSRVGTKVILIEIEDDYVDLLKSKFGERVCIEHTSAHLLDEVLARQGLEKVDLIVSGLPFLPGSLSQSLTRSILAQIDKGAIFRLFTYMPPVMKLVYRDLPLKRQQFVLRNMPPMWIYQAN